MTSLTTARIERMIPKDYVVEATLDEVTRRNADLVRVYCERHKLASLPKPRYINAEMAEMWQPDGKGGYVPIFWRATEDGIVRALEKGFLLAPPAPKGAGVETAVESRQAAEMPQQVVSATAILKCRFCGLEFQPAKTTQFSEHIARHERAGAMK